MVFPAAKINEVALQLKGRHAITDLFCGFRRCFPYDSPQLIQLYLDMARMGCDIIIDCVYRNSLVVIAIGICLEEKQYYFSRLAFMFSRVCCISFPTSLSIKRFMIFIGNLDVPENSCVNLVCVLLTEVNILRA